MTTVYSALALGALSVIAFVALRLKKVGLAALSVKVVAGMFYLLVTAAAFVYAGYPELGLFILFGQVFGIFGDIFLDQKYIHPAHAEGYTHMGFTSFGIGHIIFLVGMLRTFSASIGQILIALLIACGMSAFVVLTRKMMKLDFGPMKRDVLIYTAVIGFMTALPGLLGLSYQGNEKMLLVFFGAMVSFLISDLVLSQIYFGVDKNKPPLIIANYFFYYLAQFAISLSVVLL